MKVKKTFEDLQERIQYFSQKLKDEIDEFNDKFAVAKKNTEKFLKECEKVWIKVVSLWTETDLIPRTKTFPFWPQDSIFAEWEYVKRKWWHKRPAIRSVAEKFQEWTWCWNTWQHSFDLEEFVEWVYEFKWWCRRKVW